MTKLTISPRGMLNSNELKKVVRQFVFGLLSVSIMFTISFLGEIELVGEYAVIGTALLNVLITKLNYVVNLWRI